MVPGPETSAQQPAGSRGSPTRLIPCMLLRGGRVCVPGPDGPVLGQAPDGSPFDPFDVVDRLAGDYSILYVVDLDGVEHGEPQLDYLQELSRDMILWVDAGVRVADQAIDVLVSGARRAVLSSAYLHGPRELRRAWRLSTELAVEIELSPSGELVVQDPSWGTTDPVAFAQLVRERGPDHLILSPRERDPDWGLVARLATAGPIWVNGSFEPSQAARLAGAGASGGIFHIHELLSHWNESPLPSSEDHE